MLFQIATLAALIPYAPLPSPLSSAASVTLPTSQDRQSRAPASLYISIGPASRGRLPNVTMKRLTPFAAAVAPVPVALDEVDESSGAGDGGETVVMGASVVEAMVRCLVGEGG
ncbi:hypothetical protein V6N11_026161 [Hibiscus sabdariffa]|uniref:Secreted protein n=1 Tax=Hibiscus sabdariffa TaxID=183260 RepID=A0ABR2SVR2_9ROSI